MKTKKQHAGEYFWSVELMIECPHCDEQFDANLTDDFSEELGNAQICELVKDCNVICPFCRTEFSFDIGWGT